MENTEKLLEEPSAITSSDISNMKMNDLRKELKLRGLPISGNKQDLVNRLQNAIAKGFESLESADEVNEDEVLGDVNLLSGDDTKVQEISEDEILGSGSTKELDDSLGILASKGKTSTPADKPKTTILRTAIAVPSNKPILGFVAKQVSSLPVDASKENSTHVVKIGTLTTEERLALRAKKFNQPLSSERLKIRSERFGLVSKASSASKLPVKSISDLEKLKQRATRFGQTVASGLKQVEDKEKLLKRKQRFGTVTSVSSVSSMIGDEDKKRKRAERFGLG